LQDYVVKLKVIKKNYLKKKKKN